MTDENTSKKVTVPIKPYWYELPDEKIAQRPVHPYDAAKLLVSTENEREIGDATFRSFADYLGEHDLLLFNNTKVIPARLFGEKAETGAQIEVLLESEIETGTWRALAKPFKKLREGTLLTFGGDLEGVIKSKEEKIVEIEFRTETERAIDVLLAEQGTMPIPPYIRKGHSDDQDLEDYQTHFAEVTGSIAAPTASLHFTPELVDAIRAKGCSIEYLTLHVGTASFLPLFDEHEQRLSAPGEESYVHDPNLLSLIEETKRKGGRVVAVGTTTVRAIETIWRDRDKPPSDSQAKTDLFIQPGFEFGVVDVLVTNFHQPGTTHLLLVEAFVGRQRLESIYQHALKSDYRFLSYGDGMILS